MSQEGATVIEFRESRRQLVECMLPVSDYRSGVRVVGHRGDDRSVTIIALGPFVREVFVDRVSVGIVELEP
jgi:hypothetical protein